MRRWVESLEQFAIDVILERRYGKRAAVLRMFLFVLSVLFAGVVQLRLWLYRKRFLRNSPLGCVVISVGNLTVGGTGKTPVVERLARTLQEGGRRVAILSRGYKSRRPPFFRRLHGRLTGRIDESIPRVVSNGEHVLLGSREAGDEPYMLAANLLPGVVVLVDKDRVKSGRYAIEHFGVDTLILDDGLQYLHLQHRLDIVLVDRHSPFGNEYLLPRGTLREPPENLRRASYICITKSEDADNTALVARIRRYNRTAEIIECTHRPRHLQEVFTGKRLPLDALQGATVGALSAIAAPESFEAALTNLGARIELARRFIDHHRFSEQELRTFASRCRRRGVAMILTTEKDAVRFPRRLALEVPVFLLRVEIDILHGQESWQKCVDRICRPGPLVKPDGFSLAAGA